MAIIAQNHVHSGSLISNIMQYSEQSITPQNYHLIQRNENPENDYCEKLGMWGWEGKGW